MKTTFYILFSLLILGSLSCKEDNEKITACGVADPLNDLEWLREMKSTCDPDAYCQTSIMQGIYQNETVFFTGLDGPLCDPAFHVALLNCQGELIKEYYWENHEEFEQEVDSVKMIFSCWD
jgi:hypothetical protein